MNKYSKNGSPKKIFDAIANSYNMLNRILSLGIDSFWRKTLLKYIPEHTNTIIDLATGTGDMLFLYARKIKANSIIGVDLSKNMLNIANKKIEQKKLSNRIQTSLQDIQKTNFHSNSFDCASITFGIRNVPDVPQCLLETYRILNEKGRLLILELTIPPHAILKKIYLMYLRYFVPFVGGIVSKNFFAYQYLNNTIENFPQYDDFISIMKKNKFQKTYYKKLFGGICTLYVAEK